VLSFDTVHAITDHLYLADAAACRSDRLTAVPALLLLHEPSRATARRLVRAVEIPLLNVEPDQPLSAHLQHVAHTATTGAARSVLAAAAAGGPLLAAGVRYADVTVHDDAVDLAHRIDAVDTDGRLYRLARRPDDSTPVLLIDDIPDPADLPATHAGLAAVLTAATRAVPATRTAT
jgi:hypothetical protein